MEIDEVRIMHLLLAIQRCLVLYLHLTLFIVIHIKCYKTTSKHFYRLRMQPS